MLISSFKSYSPAGIIKVPLFALFLWLGLLCYKGQELTGISALKMPLYAGIERVVAPHVFISAFLALLLTTCSAFLLNYIVNEHSLLSKKTYLIGLFYVIYNSFSGNLLVFHAGNMTDFLLIAVCHSLFETYRKETALTECFNAGMLVGLASQFYLPSVAWFLVIWVALIIYRPFIWREYLVSLLGLLLPWVYFVVVYFWKGKLTVVWQTVILPHFSRKSFLFPNYTAYTWLYLVFGVVILLSVFRSLAPNALVPLKSKKTFSFLAWALIISAGSAAMSPALIFPALSSLSIPLAVFTSHFFLQIKRNWVGEWLFVFMLIAILGVHLSQLLHN